MGKAPKIAIFVDFHPLTLKTETNENVLNFSDDNTLSAFAENTHTRSGPRLYVGVLLLVLPRQQTFFGRGHTLDLVLKVPGYHME